MTTQEAYEQIHEYFSRPGAALASEWDEVNQRNYCKYRTESGSKCAIGCLVPDEKYNADWDCGGGENGQTVIGEVWPDVDTTTEDFLLKAQELHDDSATVESFLEKLDNHALSYGVTVPS